MIRDGAREAGQWAAAARAEELRAKACGVYEARARFRVSDNISDTGRGLLVAIGEGRITPEQGQKLLTALGSLARVIEVDELLRRVEALESGGQASAAEAPNSEAS